MREPATPDCKEKGGISRSFLTAGSPNEWGRCPGSSGQTEKEKNLERWPERAGPWCGPVQFRASPCPKAAIQPDTHGHLSRSRERASNVQASADRLALITSQIISFAFNVHANTLTQNHRESFLNLVLPPLTQKARGPTVG